MNHLRLVHLPPLMERTRGHPDVVIGLIDGPVWTSHPDLSQHSLRLLSGNSPTRPAQSLALSHGTAVAGVLAARRGSMAPALCPDCTLLVRPIFEHAPIAKGEMPSTTLSMLAAAIIDCVSAGARLLNLSVGLLSSHTAGRADLSEALDYAHRRGVLIVAAAGNQGWIGSSLLTGEAAVLPVVACDLAGQPLSYSNLGATMGRRGIMAPGHRLPSSGLPPTPVFPLSGTSAAAPVVTGTLALLWSLFPDARAAELRHALTAGSGKKASIVPSLLHAERAYQTLTRYRAKKEILL